MESALLITWNESADSQRTIANLIKIFGSLLASEIAEIIKTSNKKVGEGVEIANIAGEISAASSTVELSAQTQELLSNMKFLKLDRPTYKSLAAPKICRPLRKRTGCTR